MLFSALLFAAVVQAAPPPAVILGPLGRGVEIKRTYPSQREALRAMARREACRGGGVERADNPDAATLAGFKRLGELPMANHTLTVLRSADGCSVSSTVRYKVGR